MGRVLIVLGVLCLMVLAVLVFISEVILLEQAAV